MNLNFFGEHHVKTLSIRILLATLIVVNIQGMEQSFSSSSSPTTDNLSNEQIARRWAESGMGRFKRTSRRVSDDVASPSSVSNNNNAIVQKASTGGRSEKLIAFADALYDYWDIKKRETKYSTGITRISSLLREMDKDDIRDIRLAFFLAKRREEFLMSNISKSVVWTELWNKHKTHVQAELDKASTLLPLPLIPIDECTKFDPYLIGHKLSNWTEEEPFENPGRWDKEKVKEQYHVRKRFIYTPDHGAEKLMVFFVVHGTQLWPDRYWDNEAGPMNPEYCDPYNKEQPKFRNFMKFAAWYANKHHKRVELLSFRWPGHNCHDSRLAAAAFLNDYIKQYYFDKEIGILAHSHGCNTANLLTQIIDKKKPIDLLIYFACPVREGNTEDPTEDSYNYRPDNYKKLLYFFSTGDEVASLGGVPSKAIMKDVGAKVIKAALFALACSTANPAVIAGAAFTAGAIDADSSKRFFQNSISFQNQGKDTIGIRVQNGAKDPDHSEVPYVASVLPEICTELESNYKQHCKLNSLFDLNYDGKSLEEHKKSLCITVRERYTAFLQNNANPLLMHDIDLELQSIEQEINKNEVDMSDKADLLQRQANLFKQKADLIQQESEEMIKKVLRNEEIHSNDQKKCFRSTHGEEIDKNAKNSLDKWKWFKARIPGLRR